MGNTSRHEYRPAWRRAAKCAVPLTVGCAIGLFGLSGCGDSTIDKRAEVFGTVQLDGKPVENGAISFVPTEGNSGPSAGAAITNGTYHVSRRQGPPVGKVRVEFNGLKKTGKK